MRMGEKKKKLKYKIIQTQRVDTTKLEKNIYIYRPWVVIKNIIIIIIKGYVDLSKKRVSHEDREDCEAVFIRSKLVHSIMQHVCAKCRIPLIDAYER